jgi:hypothetical protein
MRKLLTFIVASMFAGLVFGEPPSAGWNFGIRHLKIGGNYNVR